MSVSKSVLVNDVQNDLKEIFIDNKIKEFYDDIYSKDNFHFENSKHYADIEISEETLEAKYTECAECGHPVQALDEMHGELVCEGCGLVNEHFVYKSNDFSEEFEKTHKTELTGQGKKISRLLKKYQDTPMQDYNNNQKIITLGNINTHYLMTSFQKEQVKYVINNFSLKQLHSRLKSKTIILALCIYFQKKDGRHIKINNNKYIQSYGLNEDAYNIISRNLDGLLE